MNILMNSIRIRSVCVRERERKSVCGGVVSGVCVCCFWCVWGGGYVVYACCFCLCVCVSFLFCECARAPARACTHTRAHTRITKIISTHTYTPVWLPVHPPFCLSLCALPRLVSDCLSGCLAGCLSVWLSGWLAVSTAYLVGLLPLKNHLSPNRIRHEVNVYHLRVKADCW